MSRHVRPESPHAPAHTHNTFLWLNSTAVFPQQHESCARDRRRGTGNTRDTMGLDMSTELMDRYIEHAGLADIWEKVRAGTRLPFEDGVRLYETHEATAVGYMANWVREQRHGDLAYFVRNQHINYTNICNKDCKFCSFFAHKGGPAPYELDVQAIRERVREYADTPITEIHMVGGINPRLPSE